MTVHDSLWQSMIVQDSPWFFMIFHDNPWQPDRDSKPFLACLAQIYIDGYNEYLDIDERLLISDTDVTNLLIQTPAAVLLINPFK